MISLQQQNCRRANPGAASGLQQHPTFGCRSGPATCHLQTYLPNIHGHEQQLYTSSPDMVSLLSRNLEHM